MRQRRKNHTVPFGSCLEILARPWTITFCVCWYERPHALGALTPASGGNFSRVLTEASAFWSNKAFGLPRLRATIPFGTYGIISA